MVIIDTYINNDSKLDKLNSVPAYSKEDAITNIQSWISNNNVQITDIIEDTMYVVTIDNYNLVLTVREATEMENKVISQLNTYHLN